MLHQTTHKTQRPDSTVSPSKRALFIGIAVVMVILTIAGFCCIFCFDVFREELRYLKTFFALMGMMFAAILFIGCRNSSRGTTKQRDYFILASVLLFVILLISGIQDAVDGIVSGRLLFFLQLISSVLSLWIHLMLWFYQCSSLPHYRAQKYFTLFIYILTLIYIVLLIINFFTGILFYIDASGHLYWSGMAFDMTVSVLFYFSYLLYILPQKCPLKKKAALASFAVFPLLVLAGTTVWYLKGNLVAVTSMPFLFLLLAAYVVFLCDYKEDQEIYYRQAIEMAEQELRQTELQTALMLSQIRPHFLYNALTAIRHLCKKDPTEAYVSLGLFADYIRGNMDSLSNGHNIPFEKEMEHVRTYLTLEQMRFGEELKVEYDIQFSDFSIPALSVQTIVENAVRHGATMNESGGLVVIRSFETDDGAAVTVTDNGPGFDPSAPAADEKIHLGLDNVRNSLAAGKCGALEIDSTPGSGTTVTILIRR